MASNQNASKFKVKDIYYNIKDAYARETKADKENPSFTGKIELNKGDQVTGANAVSLGYRNNSTGIAAVALGSQNEAAADFSNAAGFKTKTNTAYSTAIGKYNNPILNDLFEVGNGSSENNRRNIFRITSDGDVYVLNDIYIRGTSEDQAPLNIKKELNRIEQEIRDSQYTLEKATTQTLGGVIVGDNINIDKNGRISVTFPDIPDPYVLPAASEDSLGGVKVGENLEIENDGTLNVVLPDFPEPYELPMATATTLGGIKVSATKGFRLENGVLAFNVLKMNQINPSGSGSIKMNTSDTQGTNSVALGSNNIAQSKDTIALGLLNNVTGAAAAAIGKNNTVDGDTSITLGQNNTVTSKNAFTIGSNNENNNQSYLIGQDLISSYDNQFIIGQYNNNSENNFLEIGKGSDDNRKNILEITNNNSLNFDNKFKISPDGNLMIDKKIYITKNTTTGQYIDLLNYIDTQDTALETKSAVLDDRITILETKPDYVLPIASNNVLGGVKIGNNLIIDEDGVLSANLEFSPIDFNCYGYFSHNRLNITDIGDKSFASNGSALTMNSTAFGFESIAGKKVTTTVEEEDPETGETTENTETEFVGSIAFAEGYQTQAGGYCSHTAGYKTYADYAYQFITGYYNDNKQNNLFEIGNGTEATHSNAFEVDKNGNVIIPNNLTVNGISINTGVQSIINSDYNNLTPAEKNKDIIYLITDTNEVYYKTNKYGSADVNDVKINNVSIVNNKIANIPVMGAATSSTPGTAGLAPAPAINDGNKFLRSDATWQTIEMSVEDLSNINISSLSNGQILKYDLSNQKWINDNIELNVNDLTNINLTNLTDGQILKYDETNEEWINVEETGGTEVEANPQGTPTDTLNSIGIDGVIYGIEGGGSGGGSFEKELLYSDNYNTSRPSSITLSKSYEDYDYLEFELWKWDDGNYYDIIGSYFASKESLDSVKDGFKTGRRNVFLIYAWQNSNQYIRFTIDSITQFTNINSNGNFSISKIYGVKLGSGSGGGTEQIVDVSSFTNVYDTQNSFGNSGAKINEALSTTNEIVITLRMNGGWNATGSSNYNAENHIGAYGGYEFNEAIKLNFARFYIGRYSDQNKTLIVTIQYLDENNDWIDVEDLNISPTISYPVNYFDVPLSRLGKIYGVRWIHKKEPVKSGGNNITFFGMLLYKTVSVSGSTNLSDLSDVDLDNLTNGQILQYNSTSEKWENADNQGGGSSGGVSANAYVVEAFTPNNNANTGRTGGFTFTPVFDLEVDAFQVWARTSSTVTVKLRKVSSNEDIVSLENVSVSTGTWNNIPFASVILKAGESYIFWYHENGNALKYCSGAPTSGYLFVSTVSSVWSSDYTAVPSSPENNRPSINLHISKVIIGGGIGSRYTETTLYQSDTNESVYNLSDDISNYDLLYLEGGYNASGNELRSTTVLSVVDVIDGIANEKQYGISNDAYYTYVKPVSNVQFIRGTYQSTMFLRKIIGIKYGSDNAYNDLVETLTSGNTTVIFQDSLITTDKTYDFYTDHYGVNPVDILLVNGSITLTFEPQSENVDVKVRIS